MMKKLLTILFFALLHLAINAQTVFPLDSVNLLLLHSGSMHTVKKCGNNLYTYRYVLEFYPYKIHQGADKEPLEKIQYKGDKIVSIDELETVSVEDWIKRFLHTEYITIKYDASSFQTIEMIQPTIWIQRYYKLDDVYYPPEKRGTKQWTIQHTAVFYMNFVSLPNGKIYLQSHTNGYIVPLKTAFYGGYDNVGYLKEKFDIEKYNFDKEEHTYQTLERLNIDHFHHIEKNDAQKYELKDYYKNNLLPAAYDSIYRSQFFIITQNGNKYDIYNSLLQNIVKDADGFNFDDMYIQYVQNNQLYQKGAEGDIIHPIVRNQFRCGSVPYFPYKIEKNDEGKFLLNKEYLLGTTTDWDSVKFICGQKEIIYNSNDLYYYLIGVGYNWILVEKDKKFGIIDFDFDNNRKIVIKQIFPAVYDSITFKSYEEPIILHKDGLQQVCISTFDHNTYKNTEPITSPPFKSIEIQRYFVQYETETGKKGWYNISKGICIDDK